MQRKRLTIMVLFIISFTWLIAIGVSMDVDKEIVKQVETFEKAKSGRIPEECEIKIIRTSSERKLFIKYSGREKIEGTDFSRAKDLYRRLDEYCYICLMADKKLDKIEYRLKLTDSYFYVCLKCEIDLVDYKLLLSKSGYLIKRVFGEPLHWSEMQDIIKIIEIPLASF